MESLDLQAVAVLIPLEIKLHTLSHLEALTPSILNVELRLGMELLSRIATLVLKVLFYFINGQNDGFV